MGLATTVPVPPTHAGNARHSRSVVVRIEQMGAGSPTPDNQWIPLPVEKSQPASRSYCNILLQPGVSSGAHRAIGGAGQTQEQQSDLDPAKFPGEHKPSAHPEQ